MVRRRELLAVGIGTGAVGLAGCVGGLLDSPERELAVTAVEDAPERGIELAVEIDSPRLDGDDAPELRVELENVGESEVRFIAWGGYRAGEFEASSPSGLVTVTTEEADELSDPGFAGCWSVEELDREESNYLGEIGPGESESDGRRVLGDERDGGDACPDTGEYDFSATYTVDGGERRDVECGFTLEVSEPE